MFGWGKRLTAGRVVTTSFVVDILDVVLNLAVAMLSGSVVMLTQTLQGMADLAASGLLLVGVRESERKADTLHPFGYGRAVYFWTLISAFISLIVTSGLSIYLGWQRFVHPEPISSLFLAYAALLISIITNGYSTLLSSRRLLDGEKWGRIGTVFFRSPLVETKSTLILDLMGTVASLLGLTALVIYGLTGDWRFDGLGAVGVGVVLGGLVLVLIYILRPFVVGRGASYELEAKIRAVAAGFAEIEAVTELRTLHLSSERVLVNLDIHVRHGLPTEAIERLVAALKARITELVPEATEIQVELKTHAEKG